MVATVITILYLKVSVELQTVISFSKLILLANSPFDLVGAGL